MGRALLFLDVDGPLIPFGGQSLPFDPLPFDPLPFDPLPLDPLRLDPRAGTSNPLLARLNPAFGPRLAALPCDLVWATTWMADANEVIAPRLGLPELPVVDWPDPAEDDRNDRLHWNRLHWKTRTLVDWAAGRSFVWVDDEITDADRAWVAARHRGPALLHRVDARVGLTDADFVAIGEWLTGI